MTSGPEWERLEWPLLDHLFALGWETLNWADRQRAGVDARSSDRDVLLEHRLGSALEKINRGPDGKPWLNEARIRYAVAELRSMLAGAKLLEANRLSTELLLGGVTVTGLDGWGVHRGGFWYLCDGNCTTRRFATPPPRSTSVVAWGWQAIEGKSPWPSQLTPTPSARR